MKQKNIFRALILIGIAVLSLQCTRVVVVASDHPTDPVSKRFAGAPDQIYTQSLHVLDNLGYAFVTQDAAQFQIVTGWRPVTSGSHYLELFNRADYAATDGSYYQLMVNIAPDGVYSKVEVKTNVKSLSGKLSSSNKIEKNFLLHLDDALRSPQIQITNVGEQYR